MFSQGIFWVFASVQASILAGAIAVCLLIYQDKKSEPSKRLDRARVGSSFMLVALIYTLTVIVIGNFYLNISVSNSINKGFGEDRLAWLFIGLIVDLFMRLWDLFDPK